MNNEQLLEGIARKICLSLGKRPDRYDDHMREEWMSFIPHAQEVIDHLTPMMRKVYVALDRLLDSHQEFHDNPTKTEFVDEPAEKALASFPECWRGGV